MPSSYTLTPYTPRYATAIPELILDVYENELGFVGYTRDDIYTIPESYNPANDSNFWLAIVGDELVGTVGVFNKGNGVAYLKRLVVRKEYRKQGVGEQLLNAAVQFAKDRGFTVLYAGTVEQNSDAIAFYEHHGFTRSATVPDDITGAGDSVCLEYRLT